MERSKAKVIYRKVVKISKANYISLPVLKRAKLVRVVLKPSKTKNSYLAKITILE